MNGKPNSAILPVSGGGELNTSAVSIKTPLFQTDLPSLATAFQSKANQLKEEWLSGWEVGGWAAGGARRSCSAGVVMGTEQVGHPLLRILPTNAGSAMARNRCCLQCWQSQLSGCL